MEVAGPLGTPLGLVPHAANAAKEKKTSLHFLSSQMFPEAPLSLPHGELWAPQPCAHHHREPTRMLCQFLLYSKVNQSSIYLSIYVSVSLLDFLPVYFTAEH